MTQMIFKKGISRKIVLSMILASVTFAACKKEEWDKHYNTRPVTVDAKIWDALQDSSRYSLFVDYIKQSGFDTLLTRNQGFTLFIPDNEAFQGFQSSGNELNGIMAYLISPTVFVGSEVRQARKLQTFSSKFALITRGSDGLYYDGIKLSDNSPLFKDGTFYELSEVALPKPNLFEYTSIYSRVLYDYINKRKVILLDKNESTPIGFDDLGNTIYDSVYVEYNFFDLLYFSLTPFEAEEIPTTFEDFKVWLDLNPSLVPLLREPDFSIEKEYRDKQKTLLIFTQDQYNDALNVMAEKLGGAETGFNNYTDIPKNWQDEILIPYFFKVGVFDSSLTYDRFSKGALKNALGDSVYFDYTNIDPASRFICSNGVTFNYMDLQIPDSLFNDTIWQYGEDLITPKGDIYEWEKGVTTSDATKIPLIGDDPNSQGGKVLEVDFLSTYRDQYWIKFKLPKVFPRNYYFRYAASNRPAGIIEVYINGQYIGSHDNSLNYRPVIGAEGRINPIGPAGRQTVNFMSWIVDNITEYGDVEVKLVFTGRGSRTTLLGLNVDYVALVPITE